LLIGIPIFAVYWISIYNFLRLWSSRLNNPVQISSWIVGIGMASLPFIGVTIATIDTEFDDPQEKIAFIIHGASAITFFFLVFVLMIIITLAISELRKISPGVISDGSIIFKKIALYIMIAVWVSMLTLFLIPLQRNDKL